METNTDKAQTIIFVKVQLPEWFFGVVTTSLKFNPIPGKILSEALDLGLQTQGVAVAMKHYGGALCDCVMLFEVDALPQALKAIQDTLQRVDMLPYTSVFYWDQSESFFRPASFGLMDDQSQLFTIEKVREEITSRITSAQAFYDLIAKLKQTAESFPPAQS
ncbi:MAG: hypothetical protein JWQ71_3742 [Pedosphaera sp.]|nr:hypothetical protein [Pedosphaera sp.]